MADLTVSAAIDTFMGSADIAAIRTNIGLAAVGAGESIGWTDALLSRLAANSVGLGGRLSITAPANASALSSTGYSLTGSDATSMIDLAGMWNTSGTPTLIKVNVTNTQSNAASLLMDLQSSGASKFSVLANGDEIRLSAGMTFATTSRGRFTPGRLDGGMRLTDSTGNFYFDLIADAANTLALRNGANAQTFNVYGTYTSGSVFERMFMRYSTGNTRFEIGTETTGGTARDLEIMVPSTKIVGMDKTTEDNGFINFKATADADATSAISTLTTSGAVTHHIQIQINGVTAWIPCSTTDPS